MPASAKILKDNTREQLKDTDPVPGKVVLTEFHGKRRFYTAFTPTEFVLAMNMTRNYFLKPENQQKLDELQAQSQNDDARFSLALCGVLAQDVYPRTLRRLGLPDNEDPFYMMNAAFAVSDALYAGETREGCILAWLEAEKVMRNKKKIEEAESYYADLTQTKQSFVRGESMSAEMAVEMAAKSQGQRVAQMAATLSVEAGRSDSADTRPAGAGESAKAGSGSTNLLPDKEPKSSQIWTVVVGNGALVRVTKELTSQALEPRLASGARVLEMELVGNRLCFKKISGDGPDLGWISVMFKGAPLVKRV
eukprot:gnl/TRDRNA2_/TRDRNA2_86494_c0_seq1.p1 gnl/TRDRNA2_/TRDRNA2_86494_c0~~gnl/TRDRNA2_/TRDRNA2_86494_c0_seq1.p1  ORF type:complete len:355 (-),score=65.07 gnl/TRDRNA2_/TRDRNA2_86494_c0_seq1:185-1105(-)